MLVYRIEDQLQRAETIISNALSKPELLKKLEASKYDYKQLTYGKTLLDKVISLQNRQQIEFEKHKLFSQTLDVDRKLAYKEYIRHKKLAQIALKKKPELAQGLKLNGSRTFSATGWLEQAMIFYKNVHYISKDMAENGVDEGELKQLRAMVEALRDANNAQLKLRKIAREATLQRDKALNELQQWMYKFHTIAQIKFQDDLHTLEALGLELES